jgi:uncharacterized surface protein with fasciclin (FAS1) repeats
MKVKQLATFLVAVFFSASLAMATDNGTDKDNKEEVKESRNIVELAVETDILATLVAAVTAGDLVETLEGDGPFTVFAPTNEAFAALPAGTLENLLKPENQDQLVAILTYHVVAGRILSTDLSDGLTAETVNGEQVKFSVSAAGVTVNQASVVKADIEASNGVVHVIDKVILPPSK